jgi:hypothetical protein
MYAVACSRNGVYAVEQLERPTVTVSTDCQRVGRVISILSRQAVTSNPRPRVQLGLAPSVTIRPSSPRRREVGYRVSEDAEQTPAQISNWVRYKRYPLLRSGAQASCWLTSINVLLQVRICRAACRMTACSRRSKSRTNFHEIPTCTLRRSPPPSFRKSGLLPQASAPATPPWLPALPWFYSLGRFGREC